MLGCSDGSLMILSTADLDLIQRASQIEGEATIVDMSPDGMHIAMADSDRCVYICCLMDIYSSNCKSGTHCHC